MKSRFRFFFNSLFTCIIDFNGLLSVNVNIDIFVFECKPRSSFIVASEDLLLIGYRTNNIVSRATTTKNMIATRELEVCMLRVNHDVNREYM